MLPPVPATTDEDLYMANRDIRQDTKLVPAMRWLNRFDRSLQAAARAHQEKCKRTSSDPAREVFAGLYTIFTSLPAATSLGTEYNTCSRWRRMVAMDLAFATDFSLERSMFFSNFSSSSSCSSNSAHVSSNCWF